MEDGIWNGHIKPHLEPIFWTGICQQHRIAGMQEAEKIIDGIGFISDFKQFSDLAIGLVIEVEAGKIMTLFHELESKFMMDKFEAIAVEDGDKSPRQILFNLSFTEGHGDLKIEVPNVPG